MDIKRAELHFDASARVASYRIEYNRLSVTFMANGLNLWHVDAHEMSIPRTGLRIHIASRPMNRGPHVYEKLENRVRFDIVIRMYHIQFTEAKETSATVVVHDEPLQDSDNGFGWKQFMAIKLLIFGLLIYIIYKQCAECSVKDTHYYLMADG